jgi:hypothetical protein
MLTATMQRIGKIRMFLILSHLVYIVSSVPERLLGHEGIQELFIIYGNADNFSGKHVITSRRDYRRGFELADWIY